MWTAQQDDSAHSTSQPRRAGSGQALVGANEDVLVWDVKKGELNGRWTASDNIAQVTVVAPCEAALELFAVGYNDGRIRIWDLVTSTVIVTFNGHKAAITHLQFDESGSCLASGSKDTDIILWDLVAEVALYRLRGHKDQITSINFLKIPQNATETNGSQDHDSSNLLLSTSKDSLIKVWDLSSQHCIETHVAQTNGECWALGLSPDGSGCISAGNEGELKAWSINAAAYSRRVSGAGDDTTQLLSERGTFYRQGRDRTTSVIFHPRRDIIAVHGTEKAVELWRIRSESEIRKALTRKRKRRREKAAEEGDQVIEEAIPEAEVDISTAAITDVIVPYVIVRTGGKVRSMDWAGGKSRKSVSILISTTNNQLEVFEIEASEKKRLKSSDVPDYSRTLSVDMPGHRSDIRCLALSSDDRMLASASHGSLKIWNARTQSCLRTLECGYALCATFLPGDKIVVIGTREGTLEILDIASSQLLDTVQAHERDVWGLQVSPDGKGLVTGSADKSAKFWDFKVVQEEILGTTRKQPKLTLIHTRTLKVADDILALRFSPDHRLLAVSTLDNTIKVFFVDSLKLYLTLYGHKLPVLSIDISYDSKLVITSSADKNVRIWGLDFGDCHKTIFAHQDSILSVGFIPTNADGNGHHFFTSSKDRLIKYYDGDKFEQIQSLSGHHSEIWAMTVSHSGQFVVTASHDKSIRIWTQSDEQIFLEEERERELEELYDTNLLSSLEADERNTADPSTDPDAAIQDPSKQTTQTLMAGERITEALTIGLEDHLTMQSHTSSLRTNPSTAPPNRNPILSLQHPNLSASAYVLSVFERIPASHLQDALLVLSFSQLPTIFTFLSLWAEEGRNVPLTCRVLLFLLKVHQRQIVSSRFLRVDLEALKEKLRCTLEKKRRELGFNAAGLRVLGRKVKEGADSAGWVDGGVEDEEGEPEAGKKGKGKGIKKRTFVNVA